MKTVFIVNPQAGHGKNIKKLVESIKSVASKIGCDAQVYVTKAIGDAQQFVKKHCEEIGTARFIACGGDGTLNEVLNGAIGHEGVEVGVVPIGTGNDFCRNFDTSCNFNNISLQMTSKSIKCDAIKYSTVINGSSIEGYCANMFNIGFDCNVADLTADIKRKPFVSGSLAYFVSIFLTLVKKKCASLKIELDSKLQHDGKLLLTSIANGSYCGGGVKSNPGASTNDGYINVNIINNVSRLRFISLLPYYMKGTHIELKGIEHVISTQKCRKVTITPYNQNIRLCVDGEIIDAGKTDFEIVHNAFNFVLPTKMPVTDATLDTQTV